MKIFCVGLNKTGTTSIGVALSNLGLSVCSPILGEKLLDDWAQRDFRRIIELCGTADAFEDVPFSLPFTYQALAMTFPDGKFILTVRDSPEQWYESLVGYHSLLFGDGRKPTAEQLKKARYRYPGWIWRWHTCQYGEDCEPYDKARYLDQYKRHEANVMDYFGPCDERLLVLNVADKAAMLKLCAFVGVPYREQEMPHLNSRESIQR